MSLEKSEKEKRLRLQELYAEIATLAGGLAHEIRNPLSTIVMNLELLTEELTEEALPRDRRILSKVQTVQRECERLEEILNAFLQFARAGELDLVAQDLNLLVANFIDFYDPQARECGIEISPHLATNLPLVMMDESLMRQVLMNLAQNAQQAMPDGGVLEVLTRLRDGRVELELIDNGSGMNPRTLERMFQVFYSTRQGGSGLGLPTVRKIVEALDGTISCDSEPGQGTRFTISLPQAENRE